CDKKMFEKFAPSECSGMTKEECHSGMRERFEKHGAGEAERHEGFGGGGMPSECKGLNEAECKQKFFERKDGKHQGERDEGEEGFKGEDFTGEGIEGKHGRSGMPPECQGLSKEECRSKFFEGKGQGEIRGEGEHREFPKGFEKREEGITGITEGSSGPGLRRIERQPLGEPISGHPDSSGHPDISGHPTIVGTGNLPAGIEEKFRAEQQQLQQPQQIPPSTTGEYPKEYPQKSIDYPLQQPAPATIQPITTQPISTPTPSQSQPYPYPSSTESYPSHEGSYPTSSSGESYPSSSGSGSYPSGGGSYPTSGGDSGSSSSGGSKAFTLSYFQRFDIGNDASQASTNALTTLRMKEPTKKGIFVPPLGTFIGTTTY
ncbi:MAG: hypothetical protein AABX69_05235, partial [Nanoarchaeota archaeon]